jgi:hypothetical protein
MGPSKQGDRRRRGIEKWSLEIFRMKAVDEVEKRGVDEEKCSGESSMVSSGREEWRGSIATIDVSDRRSLEVETGMSEIAIHPVALHAVDSIPLHDACSTSTSTSTDTDKDKDTGTVRLMAYGGASGLLRIHTINILKEIVGIES